MKSLKIKNSTIISILIPCIGFIIQILLKTCFKINYGYVFNNSNFEMVYPKSILNEILTYLFVFIPLASLIGIFITVRNVISIMKTNKDNIKLMSLQVLAIILNIVWLFFFFIFVDIQLNVMK